MENTSVFEGDSHGTAIPRRQYNYVRVATKELLGSNRARLNRNADNATSIQESEEFYDQVYKYLVGPFDPEWSEHASEIEKYFLKILQREGHEKTAERLNRLIEFLADDGESFSPDSVAAFTGFVSLYRPQYPGPGIFGDDNGHVGIQWRIPSSSLPKDDDLDNRGILYLEFISPESYKFLLRCRGQ